MLNSWSCLCVDTSSHYPHNNTIQFLHRPSLWMLSFENSFRGWKCNLFLEEKPKQKKEFKVIHINWVNWSSFWNVGVVLCMEIAGRLSALWHNGDYCPYMHFYFNITFMNLNYIFCCFISPWTLSVVAFLHITPSNTLTYLSFPGFCLFLLLLLFFFHLSCYFCQINSKSSCRDPFFLISKLKKP